MSANVNEERSFLAITDCCKEYFHSPQGRSPFDAALKVMEDANFPMHNFAHHYLVPAVLLTAVYVKQNIPEEKFFHDLQAVEARAKNVLPAFCGFYGACGAAVGCGIFMSVWTGTTPLSKDSWSLCNRSTAGALAAMADMGGPRCCKRNTFTALRFMKSYLLRQMSLEIDLPEKIKCEFSRFNKECLESDCPYYEKG